MSRLQQIDPETATGRAKELLTTVKSKLGLIPNMTRAMVNSPVVLESYLHFHGALSNGSLPPRLREQIALAVAEVNGCDYCLAAHSAIGRLAGLTAEQIRDSRLGNAVDPRADAALHFARRVVATHGQVTDADLDAIRAAGFDDGAIAEVVASVVLHIFTNYFNLVARTDLDFPVAPALENAKT
jgi:uncharacterized peroxidase-related enzyme